MNQFVFAYCDCTEACWQRDTMCGLTFSHSQYLTIVLRIVQPEDVSCCSCTRILVFKVNFCTCRHKNDDLRHAFNSSAAVEHGITG